MFFDMSLVVLSCLSGQVFRAIRRDEMVQLRGLLRLLRRFLFFHGCCRNSGFLAACQYPDLNDPVLARAIRITTLRNQQAMSSRKSGEELRRLVSRLDGDYGVIRTGKVQVEFECLGHALHDVRQLRIPDIQVDAKVAIALGDADLFGISMRYCTENKQYQGRFAPKSAPIGNFQEIFL